MTIPTHTSGDSVAGHVLGEHIATNLDDGMARWTGHGISSPGYPVEIVVALNDSGRRWLASFADRLDRARSNGVLDLLHHDPAAGVVVTEPRPTRPVDAIRPLDLDETCASLAEIAAIESVFCADPAPCHLTLWQQSAGSIIAIPQPANTGGVRSVAVRRDATDLTPKDTATGENPMVATAGGAERHGTDLTPTVVCRRAMTSLLAATPVVDGGDRGAIERMVAVVGGGVAPTGLVAALAAARFADPEAATVETESQTSVWELWRDRIGAARVPRISLTAGARQRWALVLGGLAVAVMAGFTVVSVVPATAPADAAVACERTETSWSADLAGTGCDHVLSWSADDAVLAVTGPDGTLERFGVGEPGDQLVTGDWDCDGIESPTLFRPSTGEVFHFAGWAAEVPLTAERTTTAPPAASSVAAEPDGDCHVLVYG